MGQQDSVDWHGRMLRAWQLALLRFAVTWDNVDRLNVVTIAQEMDQGGRAHEARTEFSFFRKTTAICARPSHGRTTAPMPYFANILPASRTPA